MKIVPDHRYPGGTRDIYVVSLSNHSVSCGPVVPCVETSRLRDGPLEKLWGAGQSTKKKFAQRKIQ